MNLAMARNSNSKWKNCQLPGDTSMILATMK